MARGLLWITLGPALISQTSSHPLNPDVQHAVATKSDRSWLWGWAWGAESTVSVVDHTPIVTFPSRPAAFGAEIEEPILGYVIPLSSFTVPCGQQQQQQQQQANATLYPRPNNGCPKLCLSGPRHPTETWIALIQRGQCEFVKKVREAQRLGAKAVVVGGEDPERTGYPDMLVNMYSPEDSSDIAIASTYIRYVDYVQLWNMIETSNTTHSGLPTLSILITAEYSAWEWYSPIITFIIILLLPSALTFFTLMIHRIRASRAARRDRAPEDVVRGLPWRVWTGKGWEKHDASEDPKAFVPNLTDDTDNQTIKSQLISISNNNSAQQSCSTSGSAGLEANCSSTNPAADHQKQQQQQEQQQQQQPWFETQIECAICLCDFVKGDKVRVLPCHHIFHLDEVDEWLIQRKKLCPICKADVTQKQQQEPQANPAAAIEGSTSEQDPILSSSSSPPSLSSSLSPPSSPRPTPLLAYAPSSSSSPQPTQAENATERTPLLRNNSNDV